MTSGKEVKYYTTSVRLTFSQVATLNRLRGDVSQSDYIKHCIFETDRPLPRARGRTPIKDHEALARVMARLGQTQLHANFNQLVKQANIGSLDLTPENLEIIITAARETIAMRADLLSALGREVEP